MSKRQITLSDLARELGISTATVSRALKDYPDISRETKQRVLELAKKLNYRPNSMAAGLRKQESRIIGVIIPEIVNHFFSSVIKGIMQVAYDSDYRVMLCQSDERYEKEVADTEALLASRVDGLLVSLAHETEKLDHFRTFQDSGIPLVFFDKVPLDFPKVSKVVVDDHKGAFSITAHLIEKGAKKVAHFRGPITAYTSRNRYNGYVAALRHYNLPVDTSRVFACSDISFEEGYQFAMKVLQGPDPCDAIFAVTDNVALGAIVAAKELGLRIPDQLMVSGFSDWKISAVMEPSLTSVAQPSLEMGKRAVEILIQEIKATKEGKTIEHEFIELATSLKIRQSTSR